MAEPFVHAAPLIGNASTASGWIKRTASALVSVPWWGTAARHPLLFTLPTTHNSFHTVHPQVSTSLHYLRRRSFLVLYPVVPDLRAYAKLTPRKENASE